MRGNLRLYIFGITVPLLISGLALMPPATASNDRGDKKATSAEGKKKSGDDPAAKPASEKRSKRSDEKSTSLTKSETSIKQRFAPTKGIGAAKTNSKEEEADDPDRPKFLRGNLDEAEYLRLRDAHIALLRGVEPGKPFDPTARGRAITHMEHQMAELTRAAEKSRGTLQPLVFPNWVELGPSPIPNGQTQTTPSAVSGRVSAIEIDPTDPLKVYVGAAQGGVFRSLDGGATWTPIFDTAQSLAIGALALDAANGRLYVGTGEPNGSIDSFVGVGVYRIDNVNTTADLVGPINPVRNYIAADGVTPVSNPVFTGRSISKILIVPNDPTTLFVGTAGAAMGIGADAPFGGTIPPLGLRGLYRLSSVTGPPAGVGVTRITVRPAGPEGCFDSPCTGNRNVNDMVFDPGDATGNTLIVWLNGTNAASDGGVWRSTNAVTTASFTQSFATTSTTTGNGRGALAIYKEGGNAAVVYEASGETNNGVTCVTAAQRGALRVSTDGGVTFGAKMNGGGGFCSTACFYNIGLAVLPGPTTVQTDDILLIGGSVSSATCQRMEATSVDGGATFTNNDTGLHADTHVIKIAPSNPLIVYRGDDGGVFKSVDGGATWVSLNNTTFRATQFQSIAVHPTDPDFSIGGTQDNGTNNLLSGGAAWNRIDFGDGGFALIDQNATDIVNVTMYHTYFNQINAMGYARVTTTASAVDGGWSTFGCGFGGFTANGMTCAATAINFYAPMALGPGSPNTLYFGSDVLYRSANSGTTMTKVSQEPIVSGVAISSIAISPQDDNYRLVGLANGGLFFTTTGGNPLTILDPTGVGSVIPDRYVGRVFFDPNNKNTAYVCLGGFMNSLTAANSHVWKITNLNTTPVLTGINGSGITGLPDVPVNAFAVDPQQSLRLFVGTDIGVFISEDGGTRWSPYGTGLPRVAVFGMAIQNGKRVLRIATHGRGMWEIPLFAPTAAPAKISGTVTAADGTPIAGVTVRLSGPRAATAITDSSGNYRFDSVDTGNFYTVTPSLANYHFSPANRSFSLLADKTDAVFTASADAIVLANAIDTSEYFVRQHYLDFLGREPDHGGFNYWSDQVNQCNGDADCISARRIDVSAAFFMSQEFQDTGSFVYRLYKGALGRQLRYSEFSADRAQVVGGPNLEASKATFAAAFVQRTEFAQKYQSAATAEAFVDALLQTVRDAGSDLSSERTNLISRYNSGSTMNDSRSLAVRALVDNATFSSSVYNQSFVLMEYFGYLRRDPDRGGYNFWLNVLDNGDPGNYRGMVCSFITSTEYQRRFSSAVTRSNTECGR